MPEIIAVLPAYNEEVAIGSMVLRARKYARRVIVIDDGSTDRTAEVAEMAGAEVIRHPQNRGKGAALKTGFEVGDESDVRYYNKVRIGIERRVQEDSRQLPNAKRETRMRIIASLRQEPEVRMLKCILSDSGRKHMLCLFFGGFDV